MLNRHGMVLYLSYRSQLKQSVPYSPQNFSASPGISPSTSPSSGSLVARYAMESSRHLAAGIIKYCQELLPDGSSSPVSSNSGVKVDRVTGIDADNAGMVGIVS